MTSTQLGPTQSPHLEYLSEYLQATDDRRRVSPGVLALAVALIVLPLALLLISSVV